MKKIEIRSRKVLRAIFGGFSLTAIAFIFQACYGPAPDMSCDVKLTGTVMSRTTNKPIEGIKITVNDDLNYGITDKDGKFNFYANVYTDEDYRLDSVRVHFREIDGIENSLFSDTTLFVNAAREKEFKMNVQMEEKK